LHGFGSLVFGGQVGTGRALRLLEAVIDRAVVTVEACVEATAPVRARTTTKARTKIFMALPLLETYECLAKILLDIFAEVTIRW
jgi:hypothetical protein